MSLLSTLFKTNSAEKSLPRRFERKFFLPPARVEFARHMLKHLCLADRNYPVGTIHSVYYDTPELDSYYDSDDGCFKRDKIRIRWYDQPQGDEEVTAFLELKSRLGFAGMKQRQKFTIKPSLLQKAGMKQGLIPYGQIMQALAQFGYFSGGLLQPTLYSTYQRMRFVEIATGTRISIDWNIQSMLLAEQRDHQEGLLAMQGGILEIKGASVAIPASLQSLRFLETDWTRYSKYASCLETQLDNPGAPGRFWPSGRTGR